jgi:hypothetical protein
MAATRGSLAGVREGELIPLSVGSDCLNAKPDSASRRNTLFNEAARLYEDGYLSRVNQLAKPTRDKEKFYLKSYLVPRWDGVMLSDIYPHAIEEWLHTTFEYRGGRCMACGGS